MDPFTVESLIRGYHIYKEVWLNQKGEVVVCCGDIHIILALLQSYSIWLHETGPVVLYQCNGTTVAGGSTQYGFCYCGLSFSIISFR